MNIGVGAGVWRGRTVLIMGSGTEGLGLDFLFLNGRRTMTLELQITIFLVPAKPSKVCSESSFITQ